MNLMIKRTNGSYWNEENGCWTFDLCAATEYEREDELPDIIEDEDRLEQFTSGWYRIDSSDDEKSIASTVKI